MTEVEQAVADYEEANLKYERMRDALVSGEVIQELFDLSGPSIPEMSRNMAGFMERLQTSLEDRNTKLVSAKASIRNALPKLEEGKQRGWDGKVSVFSVGLFTVTSATNRWLDPDTLIRLMKEKGIYETLIGLTSFDDHGREVRLVESKWKINYAGVREWMRTHGLELEFQASYDEGEDTPKVFGPKPVSMFGESK